MTTEMALLAITAMLNGMMLAIIWSLRRCGLPGVNDWWQANLLTTVSLVLFTLRGRISDVLSIVVANAAMCWALALFHSGTMRFCGQLPRWRTLSASVGAVMLSIVVWRYLVDDINARVVAVSAFHAVFYFWAGIVLLRHRPRVGPAAAYVTTAAFALLIAAAYLLRTTVAALAALGYAEMGPNPGFHSIFLGLGTLVMPALTMGTVLMTHDAMLRRLEALANTDFLTGVLSRQAFDAVARRQIARADADGKTLALLSVDIDRFKSINDSYGHGAGDAVLRAFAGTATAWLRDSDVIGRIGGEEFLILMPDTSHADAQQMSEHIRAAAETDVVDSEIGCIAYTISGGCAEWQTGETLEQFTARADTALYLAKRRGRNRICLHDLAPA